MRAAIRRFVCRMLWRHEAVWHDYIEDDGFSYHILHCYRCNVVERIAVDE